MIDENSRCFDFTYSYETWSDKLSQDLGDLGS
jgi:hypothetical protein